MKRNTKSANKFLGTHLFSFDKLTIKDRLIIVVFTLAGYQPTSRVVSDQWRKGDLTLVHSRDRGWYQFDDVTQKTWAI